MYIARCTKCQKIMGAVRDPSRFTWLRCMECGNQNNILHCIDPNEHYEHPSEKMVNEREADLHADATRNIKGITGR